MKKLLSIMLAAILLLTSFAIPAYAEGPVLFELVLPEGYEHGVDEVIVAEIRVKNNDEGISAATFYIDLPECLTTQTENAEESINPADRLIGYFATGGWASDGDHRLSAGFMGLRALKGDGALLTVNLVPADGATKEDLENMTVSFGVRETKTADGVTHKGEDDDVKVSDTPIKTPEVSCAHPETEDVDGKDPTCTEPGYGAGKRCVFCGAAVGDTQQIPALGHDYKFEKKLEEATCTNPGKDLYKCSRCGDEDEREVPMKDHVESSDYKHDDNSHWHYCVNCDTVIGDKEAHNPDAEWHCEDASVNGHYHICSICKAPVGVQEHVDDDSDGECDICGAALHKHIADESKWLYDDEGHYHACTVPGCKAKLDKTAHNTETNVTKEATCTEKGVKTTTCKVCDYEKTEDIDMIPHTPDTDWHTEEGSKEHWHVCAVCGTKLEETAAAHTYGEYTSTEKDHTHVCTACGASETEAHKGGTATCSKKAVCEVCDTEYGSVDKTNHADGIDGTAWESDGINHWNVCKYCKENVNVESHKESTGYKHDENGHWHYCTVCGYELEKTAHSTSTPLKCDQTGHWSVCDSCGEKYGFEKHINAILIPEKKPTASENGNVAYWYCPDCGKYFYDIEGEIGAGPYDSADQFITKLNVGCNGNHLLVCVPVNDMYHMFICQRQCGFVMTLPHNFGLNGMCLDCGYTLAITEDKEGDAIDVDVPTEGKINCEE